MSIMVLIHCDGPVPDGLCGSRTGPARSLEDARGLALAAGWHLGGRAGDRCPTCNPRPRPRVIPDTRR